MKKRRRRLRKRYKRILFVFLLLFIILLIFILLFIKFKNTDVKKFYKKNSEELKQYVITKEKTTLYLLENDKYKEDGFVNKGVILHLDGKKKGYYKITGLDKEYYIKNSKLSNYQDNIKIDDRYKNYIVFNSNINTKNKTDFYDEEDNLVYSINESYSLPIIIKEDERYGVEFGDRLLYIKSDSGEVSENQNTEKHNASGVAVLNYHAFYDDDNEEEKKECTSSICHSDTQFKSHLDYFKDNNIFVLKMKEVEMYIDGKIQLPKSVLITIDDGGMTKIAVDMLTEYKMYGTIFLISSWFDVDSYYVTEYIELHSHSHHMHETGVCPQGQGGGIQCLSEEIIQEDLKTSRKLLNNTTYFCYPFYEYNDYSIEQLKKAGFTMAFIGESRRGDNLVHTDSNKFKLRRFVIVDYTTMNDLSNYINQID